MLTFLQYSSWPYVFKTSPKHLAKTSLRHLQDALPRHLPDVFKTSSRRIVKTSSRYLQDVLKTSCKGIFKMFSRRIIKLNCCCEQVFEMYLTRFKTYCKDGYLQKDLPRSHFSENYGQWTKSSRVIKFSQVLVFHFTTPVSGCLQRRI